MAAMYLDRVGTVCFYNDTINSADKKLVCIYERESVIESTFTYRIKNLQRDSFMNRGILCRIVVDHYRKKVYYRYDSESDAILKDFESVHDFLQTCGNEPSKMKIVAKMVALHKTTYSEFIVNCMSEHLYGKSYVVQKCLY
jgi:hypothetical protein